MAHVNSSFDIKVSAQLKVVEVHIVPSFHVNLMHKAVYINDSTESAE